MSDTRTCDACTAPAVVFEPGREEIRELFLLRQGVPLRCWCIKHWLALFGVAVAEHAP